VHAEHRRSKLQSFQVYWFMYVWVKSSNSLRESDSKTQMQMQPKLVGKEQLGTQQIITVYFGFFEFDLDQ